MPVVGLEQFAREAYAAGAEAIELSRRGLGRVAAYAHRTAIETSPIADPDAPGSGRLRASWTISRNTPDEQFVPLPPGGTRLAPPSEALTQAVVNAIQLGDVIWISNGSPCVSTVNDRTSFVDAAIAAAADMADQVAGEIDRREVSGARSLVRARGTD